MPTTDIIGYLAENRQSLSLDTTTDILQMAADLSASGLRLVQLDPIKVLGIQTGVSVQWVHLESDAWGELVHDAIVGASVSDMLASLGGESE